MDEEREYGMSGAGYRDRGQYQDDRGGYRGRSSGASEYDAYDASRGGYGARRAGMGYGSDQSTMLRSGMANRGMGYAGNSDRDYGSYGRSSYGGSGYGDRDYGQDRYRGNSDDRGFFERAGDEIASWFGDDDAQRRREQDAGHRGRGPRNYSRSDDRIREDISDRLSDDRHLDASDIEVSVSGGEVTLDGTVDSRTAKRHAEDLAESCSGVNHVQNNLRVADRRANAGLSGTMMDSKDSPIAGTTGASTLGMGNGSATSSMARSDTTKTQL